VSACLLVGGKAMMIASAMFTLSWTHSVEKTGWQEQWQIAGSQLQLMEARVRGSGAGMEPGDGAVLVDGWWVWNPDAAPLNELLLASSGATGNGWRLCSGGECREIGANPGEAVRISPCAHPVKLQFQSSSLN
jgi:hypothetical protein